MITVGVDLAAEPARTAVAVLTWYGESAEVTELLLGADDAAVLARLATADRSAVDAPFGWPEPFVDFLLAHRAGRVDAPAGVAGLEWRRTLSRRATDRAVAASTGVTPMSVSADRIAAVAMRAAGLLGALAAAGTPVDRADGVVVEAYPAAALKRWGLPHRSYKRAENQSALGALVDALLAALPDLHLPAEQDALCRASDDALDAVVCALIARAAALGLTDAPPLELRALAEREGWIAVPGCSLRDLLDERVRER